MADNDQYNHQRRLLAESIVVGCVISILFCTYIIQYDGEPPTIAVDSYRGLSRRRRLLTPSTMRVRSHATSITNDSSRGKALDSHGHLVEVAFMSPIASPVQETTAEPKEDIEPTLKIINGSSYSRPLHPYIARIYSGWFMSWKYAKNYFFCGGSLISPNVVLTAAHCLGKDKYVGIYSPKLKRPIRHRIEKSIRHPKYKDGASFGYDVGLILIANTHLDVEVETDETGTEYWGLVDADEYDWVEAPPIVRLHRTTVTEGASTSSSFSQPCSTLSEAQSQEATTLTVLGYGKTDEAEQSFEQLQGADLHYMLNADCEAKYRGRLPPDVLCAWDEEEGQGTCNGDSGGPLLTKVDVVKTAANDGDSESQSLWTQVGIVVGGKGGCASSKYPGVFSRMTSQIDWIEEIVCGRKGLSPMSCVPDQVTGEMYLRDYTAESVMRTKKKILKYKQKKEAKESAASVAGARPGQVMKVNATSAGVSKQQQGVRRDKIQLSISTNTGRNPGNNDDRSRFQLAACELLEGNAYYNAQNPDDVPADSISETIVTSPATSPTKDQAESDIDPGRQEMCKANKNKMQDVEYFLIGNKKKKDCEWVGRKCTQRCSDYSTCCPDTCSRCPAITESTAAPTANSPTSAPTKDSSDTAIDSGRQEMCQANKNKMQDVEYFLIGNKKKKDCEWAGRKCTQRCSDYSTCCPDTCSKCTAVTESATDTAPTANSPTSGPTKDTSTTDIDSGGQEMCSANNDKSKDVEYFVVKNKERDCEWVRKKCAQRCVEYSACCPETCGECQIQKKRMRVPHRE